MLRSAHLVEGSLIGTQLVALNYNHRDTAMSAGAAARAFSIPELLRALNEKLGEECSRVREIPLSFALSM